MSRILLVKIAVFIFTFLLIFGSIILFQKICTGWNKQNSVDINLAQPAGSAIKQIGSVDDNLYIQVTGGQIPDRIIIFNPNYGKIVSNLILN